MRKRFLFIILTMSMVATQVFAYKYAEDSTVAYGCRISGKIFWTEENSTTFAHSELYEEISGREFMSSFPAAREKEKTFSIFYCKDADYLIEFIDWGKIITTYDGDSYRYTVWVEKKGRHGNNWEGFNGSFNKEYTDYQKAINDYNALVNKYIQKL